ncbi:MAG: VWA domain-containing protein [Dermatophilaceae bacterium]
MGRHAKRRSNAPIIVGVALLVAALVLVGAKLFAGSSTRAGNAATPTQSSPAGGTGTASCPSYTIATSADVAPVVTRIVGATIGCHPVELITLSSNAFLERMSGGTFSVDAWISDAPAWIEAYDARAQNSDAMPKATVGRSLASTPVVLAVPASIATPQTTGPQKWLDALTKLPLSSSSTAESTPTALAFTAVWQMFASLPGGENAISKPFFEIVRAQVPATVAFERASGPASTAKAFPASEQQIATWNAAHPNANVEAFTPAEGPPLMKYTLVRFDGPAHDDNAFAQLEQKLTSRSAGQALSGAFFRPESGVATREVVKGVPATLPGTIPTINTPTLTKLLADMEKITRKVSILNVVDVSGSMIEKAGGHTRIDLAISAVNASMAQLPDTARAGLWVFSSDRRPGGRDYEEILNVATLGSARDSGSQRVALEQAVNSMGTLISGDTGLYDTIAAAFESARKNYLPDTQNIVIVVTDGKNDDPTGGLDESGLIARLRQLQDRDKPVRLVLIGMGPNSDVAAMKRITGAVDGITSVSTNPNDLGSVLAAAVWTVGDSNAYATLTNSPAK